MADFKIVSPYQPSGDQPEAINKLVDGINKGYKDQILLGVTGSGKTYTIANVIEKLQRPTLVFAHNKTLAAQLCSELKELFPDNAVEYFVSYYDYFQPEAYLPTTDTYIEKDQEINDEIDRLRHSATSALLERRDVIIVASVSCIYSLGDPEEYKNMVCTVRVGQKKNRDILIVDLIKIRYTRNDYELVRGNFRVRGDVVEIFPASTNEYIIRIEFFDDEIDRINELNPITGELRASLSFAHIYPAAHYITTKDKMEHAIEEIVAEMEERIEYFEQNKKLIEAQRVKERTLYDIEFLRAIGYCKGVENYSRTLSGREPGSIPRTLLDYFPDDFLTIIDESHASIPQVRGMSGGDTARKRSLIDYGFRLPSAYDNRPLRFEEFESKIGQTIYVSATPGIYERERAQQVVEQIIRPTGLIDPVIDVRPTENQIDDLMTEIFDRIEKKERVLVVTITKRLAEALSEYFKNMNINVRYMHHEVDTLDRIQLLRELRLGDFDVLIGINLLREGLDLPEVSLIAILDADKQGFLRNETSLIQIIGRAARNSNGKVIMYADHVSDAMEKAIKETERRRNIQTAYNEEHGIIPKTIIKTVKDQLNISSVYDEAEKIEKGERDIDQITVKERESIIEKLTEQMKTAAKQLDFELAAQLRDKIVMMQNKAKKGRIGNKDKY